MVEQINQPQLKGSGELRVDLTRAGKVLSADLAKKLGKAAEKEIYRARIEHLAEYGGHPILEKIKSGASSFTQELKEFYGITDYARRYSKLTPEDKNKIGTTPKDLIQIVEGLSGERFDLKRLDYNSVRESYTQIVKSEEEEHRARWGEKACVMLALPALASSFVVPIGVPIVCGLLGGVVYCFKEEFNIDSKTSKLRSNGGYSDYTELSKGAVKSQDFVEEAWGNPIILAYLANKSHDKENKGE